MSKMSELDLRINGVTNMPFKIQRGVFRKIILEMDYASVEYIQERLRGNSKVAFNLALGDMTDKTIEEI